LTISLEEKQGRSVFAIFQSQWILLIGIKKCRYFMLADESHFFLCARKHGVVGDCRRPFPTDAWYPFKVCFFLFENIFDTAAIAYEIFRQHGTHARQERQGDLIFQLLVGIHKANLYLLWSH